jgi:hypothetical protein
MEEPDGYEYSDLVGEINSITREVIVRVKKGAQEAILDRDIEKLEEYARVVNASLKEDPWTPEFIVLWKEIFDLVQNAINIFSEEEAKNED